jgi:hypothetical protein
MKKTLRPVPTFANEAEERRFWEAHDSTDYVDWSMARRGHLPNLKPSGAASIAGHLTGSPPIGLSQ